MTRRFRNPVLPGFYPDPSVCRVGEDYYLVNSTFEYFPGLPIHHSRDLVHWRPLGYVLDRPEQLPLQGIRPSGGLYAPTIRYHDGTFYVVCTLVDGTSRSGNFVVIATDPAGPWSSPHYLEDAPGFDPSLFFDDDGRVWFTGSRPAAEPEYEGHTEIWMRELDLDTMRLVGETFVLTSGALRGAIWAEGPHVYKVDGQYYLVIAEGGTGHDHAVTVHRADTVTGPYQGNPRNPVLTHRHLGREHPIVGTGHGDLIQTQTGEWWMVLLAMRPYGGYFYNLGRETFLAPVTWEEGWPVVSPGIGQVQHHYPFPDLPPSPWPTQPACDHFDAPVLAPQWNMLRTPDEPFWSLQERPGHLRLRVQPWTLADWATPSFVGRRQQHPSFTARLAVDFTPAKPGEYAALALLYNSDFHLCLLIGAGADTTGRTLRLTRRAHGVEETIAEQVLPPDAPSRILLAAEARGQHLALSYAVEPERWHRIGPEVDTRFLSPSVAGGFTGVYVGMYATSTGSPSDSVADFDWFEYQGQDHTPA